MIRYHGDDMLCLYSLPLLFPHRTYTFSLAMDLNSRKDGDASSRRNGEFQPPSMLRNISSIQALQVTDPGVFLVCLLFVLLL